MEPKLRISKQLADFMQPSRGNKDREKHLHDQKTASNREKIQKEEKYNKTKRNDQKINEKEDAGTTKTKGSRNPFQPIQQWIKYTKMMESKINEVRNGIQIFQKNSQLFSKQQTKDQVQQPLLKYQQCLTLETIKKTQNSCLKKILHVPTLCIYYLRESAIDFHIDKSQLQVWIKQMNAQAEKSGGFQGKIIQLYWNVPESYYSLLYQFTDGITLEAVLESINTLPLSYLKKMIKIILSSGYHLFNSQIFITKDQGQSSLFYLPIYEEVENFIHRQRNFRQLLKLQHEDGLNQDLLGKKMVARLGFLVMVSYFGDTIVDEDISGIFFENEYDCCLIHRFLNNSNSLTSLFVQLNLAAKQNESLKQGLIDFVCKCLKFKPDQRASYQQLKSHKFLKTADAQSTSPNCTMAQVIQTLQVNGTNRKSARNNISQQKMKKILETMTVILQGSKETTEDIDFTSNNENIRQLVKEFGLISNDHQINTACNQLSKKLKKMYV